MLLLEDLLAEDLVERDDGGGRAVGVGVGFGFGAAAAAAAAAADLKGGHDDTGDDLFEFVEVGARLHVVVVDDRLEHVREEHLAVARLEPQQQAKLDGVPTRLTTHAERLWNVQQEVGHVGDRDVVVRVGIVLGPRL